MGNADDGKFEALYKYYPGVFALMRRLGFPPDEAEDLTQDTFIRVLRGMEQYREESKWAFVQTTARRVALNAIRAKHTAKRDGQTVSDDALANREDPRTLAPDAVLAQGDTVKEIRESVAQLPENDRQVLLLQLDGRSYEEIMAILDLSLSAVKSRLNAARKHLKELLESDPGLGGK